MRRRRYNLPPLNALKTFEAFGRHLNLHDAADELCVTQSAVSRQLRHLEEHLGVKLLERIGRSTQLTDLGHRYLNTLSTSLSSISDMTDSLFPKQRTGGQELLLIGIDPIFAHYWLTPRLGSFRKQHPEIALELYVNHNMLMEAPLEQVDLEIYTGRVFPLELHCDKLFHIHDFAVCSPSLLEGDRQIQTARDLLQLPLLHEGSPHWWPAWLEAVGCTEKPDKVGPVIYDEVLCIKLALEGQGVVLGDHISSADFLRNGKLVRPTSDTMVTEDWVSLLIKPEKLRNPAVEAFRNWIQQAMADFKKQLDDYPLDVDE